jgi:hypothetical protein
MKRPVAILILPLDLSVVAAVSKAIAARHPDATIAQSTDKEAVVDGVTYSSIFVIQADADV